MAQRLIDDGDARRRILAFATGLHSEVLPVDAVMMLLTQIPTVDAVPVVHGRWNRPFLSGTKRKNPFCYCTNCAYPVQPKWASNYCPSCGAKMDLEV